MRATVLLRRIVLAGLICILLPDLCSAQGKARPETARTDSSTVRVGIRDFKKLQGDKRWDVLEDTFPHLLHAGLFSQKWLDVSLLGKASPGEGGTGAAPAGKSQEVSLSGGGYDLIVEGEFLEVSEDRLRLDLVVKDPLRGRVVFRDSAYMDSQQIMATMGQMADRLATTLREKVLLAKAGERMVVVVGPFENGIPDPSLKFLDSSLPLEISKNSENAASRNSLVFQPLMPGMTAAAAPKTWDIRVTGKISLVEGFVLISGTYQERTGLSLPVEHREPVAEPLKAVEGFSRKVWEIITARVAPGGTFRNEPLLFANSTPESLFARGQQYEQSGENDVALFMYAMAVRRKADYLAARLRIADIYREREAYDVAEAQYSQVLVQDSQNAAAHFGLGLLYSKRGNYEKALQELERASSLSSTDPKLQFETRMRTGDVYLLMNQPDRSIQLYLQAQTVNKTSAAPYVALGKACRAKKDLDGAVDYLAKGLALWPGDKTLRNDLASALNDQGKQRREAKNYAKALEAFQKTLELDPPDVRLKATAYLQTGVILGWEMNDFPRGIGFLEKATEIGPNEEVNFRALGLAYRATGKYKEAIEALKKAIAIAPQYQSYWTLAETYRLTHAYDLGIESVKKAVELDSGDADGYILLGALYESKFDDSRSDKESFQHSVENLKLGIQHAPQSESAPRILGILYSHAGEYENAVTYLNQAIAVKPTVWSYTVLGESYWKLKKPDDAIAKILEGLKLDHRYESAYDDLEEIYSATNQSEKFVQLLKDKTQLDPQYIFPFIKLGILSRKEGKYQDAAAWLEKAIAIDQENEWAQRVLGLAYSDMARGETADKDKRQAIYVQAVAHLDKAIQIEPTAWAYAELGRIYADLGDPRKAAENLEKSIQKNPRYEQAYTTLESIYDKQGHGEDFNGFLEGVVAKNPDFYWARKELVNRYYSLNEMDRLIEHANKALALQPKDAEIYAKLAEALRSKKEYGKAYENARKAVDLSPQNGDAIWTLVFALLDQGQPEKAASELEGLLPQNEKSPLVFALLGETYRQEKSFAKAHEYVGKAIELAPRYAYPRLVLGRTYFDEGKLAETITSAKEALTILPDYGAAQGLLYQTAHQLGRDQEAAQFLEQLLAQNPQSERLMNAVGFVNHEFIRDYEKAYDAFGKLYERHPKDWSITENFAEANLTTGRLDEVLKLTAEVLSSKDASVQSKLSMKLFQVAAYLMKGEQARAFAELGLFRDQYKSVPKDYDRGWTYEGTKNYVQTHSGLKPGEKSLLLRMIDLLEAQKEDADAKLRAFEASFAEMFADLKAAAAVGNTKHD